MGAKSLIAAGLLLLTSCYGPATASLETDLDKLEKRSTTLKSTATPVIRTVPPPAKLSSPPVPPEVTALPVAWVDSPVVPPMTKRGLDLVVEFEGYATYPEAPDARFSGVSTALGYDWSTVSPKLSVQDWRALPAPGPQRLAATHSYTGRAAQAHLHEVKDIRTPREIGFDVFNQVDVPRFYTACARAFPGFKELRPNARDAILSLGYNRGLGMTGPNRTEMRELRPLIKAKDYVGMADCVRRMKRVWKGTSIQTGMERRREAEARLIETP